MISFTLHAQDELPEKTITVEIEKKDATILRGKLLGLKNDTVNIVSSDGSQQRISMSEIRSIDYIDPLKKSRNWGESPNLHRYLIAPTGFALKKNDIVFENTYLLINSLRLGLSNRVTAGIGGDVFGGSMYFVNAKVNVLRRTKYRFSTGMNYFRLPKDFIETTSGEDIRDLGLLYGASTWGNSDNNLSVGVGYLFFLTRDLLPPVVTLSGTTRIAKNFALVTENWFLFVGKQLDIPVIISLGLRYIGHRSTLDLAYFGDHEFSGHMALPYISYSFKISR